jgi:hypothetical protein
MKRRVVLLAVLGLALVPATALAAATMTTPRTAKLGSRITVTASGLKPGSYSLWLALEVLPGGAAPTICSGKIGATVRPVDGKVRITGTLPSLLGCYMGVGQVGRRRTTPGDNYHLTLGDSFHQNGFDENKSFVTHIVRLTR